MSKDKQIEEMARTICNCYDSGVCEIDEKPCDLECGSVKNAKELYAKGYRKADEVAREIFEEIEKILDQKFSINHGVVLISKEDFAELKKKYTKREKDNGKV